MTWVLNLHENVNFHNGNSLNADSVISTFDYYIANNIGTALDTVTSYEATGEYQVTLSLSAPSAELMYYLSVSTISIFDTTAYDEMGLVVEAAYMAGSGPYMITDYAIGDYITFEAVEDYWYPERQAHIETVTCDIISNTSTQASALSSGELDYGDVMIYTTYETLMGNDNLNIIQSEDGCKTIWFNVDNGLCEYLSNDRVREALTMMIDMEQVMLVASGGYGGLNYNALNYGIDYVDGHVYDPEGGLAILEEEGIDPSDITLTAITNAFASDLFVNIQAQLMEYGVTLEFVVQELPAVLTAGLNGEWDLWCEMGGLTALPYYGSAIGSIWSETAGQPVVQDNDIVDTIASLTSDYLNAADLDEGYAILEEAVAILDENYAYIGSYSSARWAVFSDRIQNPVVCANSGSWYIWDSWVE